MINPFLQFRPDFIKRNNIDLRSKKLAKIILRIYQLEKPNRPVECRQYIHIALLRRLSSNHGTKHRKVSNAVSFAKFVDMLPQNRPYFI